MEITKQNYVDVAEEVIKKLRKPDRKPDKNEGFKLALTTSKIRNILSMVSELYTDAQHARGEKLSEDMVGRVQYLRMRIAYEAGREGRKNAVKDFVNTAELLPRISEIGNSRQKLLLFCNYMEALVAYHKFYGGD